MDPTKIKETLREYYNAEGKMCSFCHDFLNEVLKKNNGTYKWNEHFDDYICVAYTGGNHPEYASNMCSTLYEIFLKEDSIYFSIEDGVVPLFDMLTIDLAAICERIADED